MAVAAAELAPLILSTDPNWRNNLVSGATIDNSLGNGIATIIFVDENDGDFSTGQYDPVRVYGMGSVGNAVRVRSVLLSPNTSVPMSCLEVSAHSVDDFIGMGGTLTSDQIVSTADSITGIFSTINADVEYMGMVASVTINGSKTKVSNARTVPVVAIVFDHYVQNGTVIPLATLPIVNSNPTIDGTVLTATFNPYTGETNPAGIYVIDCAGGVVDIQNSRIEGTLVLLNAEALDFANHCQIRGQVSWKPAIPNYPALLVQGDLDFSFQGDVTMSESVLGVNLNPDRRSLFR